MTKSVAEKFSRGLEHTADEVVHDLRHAQQRVRARAEDAADAITDLVAEARDRTQALAKTAVRTVRDRPITAVAIAVGVATILGFVIGRVVQRKA
jgi:ElaB/YqjD/DUF883 family membrane-anchored ribosome-binding protein